MRESACMQLRVEQTPVVDSKSRQSSVEALVFHTCMPARPPGAGPSVAEHLTAAARLGHPVRALPAVLVHDRFTKARMS